MNGSTAVIFLDVDGVLSPAPLTDRRRRVRRVGGERTCRGFAIGETPAQLAWATDWSDDAHNPFMKDQAREKDVNGQPKKAGVTGGSFAAVAPNSQANDGLLQPQTAPRKPGQVGGFEVKAYKRQPDGGFDASIWRDGKRVLIVENTGRSGSNLYTDLNGMSSWNSPDITAFNRS